MLVMRGATLAVSVSILCAAVAVGGAQEGAPPGEADEAPELEPADLRAIDALATSLSEPFSQGSWTEVTRVLPTELQWEQILVVRKQAETVNLRLRGAWRRRLEEARGALARPERARLVRCEFTGAVWLAAAEHGLKERLVGVEGLSLVGECAGLQFRIPVGHAARLPDGWRISFLD